MSHDLHFADKKSRAQKGLRPQCSHVSFSMLPCSSQANCLGNKSPVAFRIRGSDTIALTFRMVLHGGFLATFHSGLSPIYCWHWLYLWTETGFQSIVERVNLPARSIHLWLVFLLSFSLLTTFFFLLNRNALFLMFTCFLDFPGGSDGRVWL